MLACLLAVAIASAPATARARDDEPSGDRASVVAAATVCSLVYSPIKLAYATSGLVVGSLAWIWTFGNRRVTRPIFRATLRGDYFVKPSHLTGHRKLRFIGRR